MRKRNNYAVLEKKLKEQESELNSVIAITRERPPCHELLSESIANRFLFLRKLLTAEVESHTYTETHHLRHIRQRLDGLETAFHEWDNFKTTTTTTTTTPNYNHTDTVSACSCSTTGSDHEDNDEGGGGGGNESNDGCGSSGVDSPVYEEEKENLQECVYEDDDDKEENLQEYIYEEDIEEEENRESTSVVTTVEEEEENAESGIIIGKVEKSNVYEDSEEENCESTSVVVTTVKEEETAEGRIIIGKVDGRRRTEESRRSAIFGFILAAMLAVLMMAWLSGFWVYEWEMETSFLTPT